jgi:hypothetical protein
MADSRQFHRSAAINTYRVHCGPGSNVDEILASPDAVEHLKEEFGEVFQLRFVRDPEPSGAKDPETERVSRRGRKPGSTNWSCARFHRKYERAARNLKRPYRGVALATGIGLAYATFKKYLELWGPPAGFRAPGD